MSHTLGTSKFGWCTTGHHDKCRVSFFSSFDQKEHACKCDCHKENEMKYKISFTEETRYETIVEADSLDHAREAFDNYSDTDEWIMRDSAITWFEVEEVDDRAALAADIDDMLYTRMKEE